LIYIHKYSSRATSQTKISQKKNLKLKWG